MPRINAKVHGLHLHTALNDAQLHAAPACMLCYCVRVRSGGKNNGSKAKAKEEAKICIKLMNLFLYIFLQCIFAL